MNAYTKKNDKCCLKILFLCRRRRRRRRHHHHHHHHHHYFMVLYNCNILTRKFDFRMRKQLHGMTGNELFSLTKSQLEKHCGKEEGQRLDSQITVQRNVSGVSKLSY
jgi:hypothetical protein